MYIIIHVRRVLGRGGEGGEEVARWNAETGSWCSFCPNSALIKANQPKENTSTTFLSFWFQMEKIRARLVV